MDSTIRHETYFNDFELNLFRDDDVADEATDKQPPIASVGLIADIQYADCDDEKTYDKIRLRYYRNSLELTKRAVEHWKSQQTKPKFIVQLGDIIDAKASKLSQKHESLNRVIEALEAINDEEKETTKVLHVWGNHDLNCFDRSEIFNTKLNTANELAGGEKQNANYYSVNMTEKYKLIILDCYENAAVGYKETDEAYKNAISYMDSAREDKNPTISGAVKYKTLNGRISDEQMRWLASELTDCRLKQMKSIVFGHVLIIDELNKYIAWNSIEMNKLFESFDDVVVAYISGHKHYGAYDVRGRIHHIALPGIIETMPGRNSFANIDFYSDKIKFRYHSN